MGLKITEMVQIIAQNGDKMKGLKRKMLCRHGISSLELAVVLALIAIMATFTIPYLGSWLKHYRVVGASREVASTLQEARIKAVANNLQYRVAFDRDNDTYWLEQKNDSGGSASWTAQGGVLSLPKGVTFTDGSDPPNDVSGMAYISFNPIGTTSVGVGSIYILGQDGTHYRITVLSTTGRVWIRVRKGASWEPA